MNQAVQIFTHPEFGGVRIIGDSENPLFCLADVCKVLAIGNPSDVKKRLDKGVVSIETLQTAGGMQSLVFVNEDGLYDVILDSRKSSAKKFRKWVTSEILPTIRKNGVYMTAEAAEKILYNPDFIINLAQQVKEAQAKIALLQPKADYCEKVLESPEALNVTIIAKEYGMSGVMFNQLLYSFKIQYPQGRTWVLYQDYVGKGYTIMDTVITKNGGTATQMKWTQKGRYFLYNELKKHRIVPWCEREEPMIPLFGEKSA